MKIKFHHIVIGLIISICAFSNLYSHTGHYKNIKVIEMDVYRNGEIIGYSNYLFKNYENIFEVVNETKFEVKIAGVKIFSIKSISKEKYQNDQLIEFNSETMQNDKKKFVNLVYDKSSEFFIINGSSYKGKADKDLIIGTWWNHEIVQKKAQISAVSGRIIEQKVEFIGKEDVRIGDKTYKTLRFNFSSSDPSLSKDKKLNTDIWYEEDTFLWVKAAFDKTGYWEYRLKKVK